MYFVGCGCPETPLDLGEIGGYCPDMAKGPMVVHEMIDDEEAEQWVMPLVAQRLCAGAS